MRPERTNIKLRKDLVEELRERKGPRDTWDDLFREEILEDDADETGDDVAALRERIDDLETTIPKLTADELETRLR